MNRSFALTKTGFVPVLASVFTKVDADSSGTISAPELGTFLGRMFQDVGAAMEDVGQFATGLGPYDLGPALSLSKTQMEPALANIFERVDRDSSGSISMTELGTYLMSVLEASGEAVKRMGGVTGTAVGSI